MLGWYGDTRVEPVMLFDPTDPAGGGPPPGSIDVQFRCPLSLSVLLAAMGHAGLEEDLAAFGRGFGDLVAAMVPGLQFDAGYVADGARRDSAPARLELAAVIDETVPGIQQPRWHAHIYIGPTAVSLIDGARWPVDLDGRLRRAIFSVTYPGFANRLRELAARELGVVWGEPRPGSVQEIVDPPWYERISVAERGVCLGRWGPRLLLLSDERNLRMAAETEQRMAAARARGEVPDEPTWQEAAAAWDRFFTANEQRYSSGSSPGPSISR